MKTVGIDFGTTKTLVAYLDESSGRTELVHLGRSGPELPTTVHVDKERQLLFGDDADDQLAIDPGGYLRRIKLGIGTSRKFLLNGHEFSAIDLCAKFLEHIRTRIETEHFHGKLDRTVITVPAKFGPAARKDLETAAKQAGFENFELLDEPIAAGIAFLEEKKGSELGSEILVFDWGGGTLDIALVERKESGDWVLNHDHLEGDPALGGEDIDDALFDAVNDQLEQSGQQAVTPAQTGDYPQLHRRVVETKKLLSKKESHSFSHATDHCQLNFSCSREDFEQLIAEQTTRAMQCVARWRERAGARDQPNRNVLLVGGSSQIPIVGENLKSLGLNPIPWTRGMHAVAMGAALKAANRTETPDSNALLEEALAILETNESSRENEEKAFQLFLRSAELGNAIAMNWVGLCYRDYRGVAGGQKNELHEAGKWFRNSAEAGDPDGMFNYGECLLFGKCGVRSDSRQAFLQFLESAEKKHTDAMVRVGLCYKQGTGTPRDETKAQEFLRAASEFGSLEGKFQYGQLLLNLGPFRKNEAMNLIRKAASLGHPGAKETLNREEDRDKRQKKANSPTQEQTGRDTKSASRPSSTITSPTTKTKEPTQTQPSSPPQNLRALSPTVDQSPKKAIAVKSDNDLGTKIAIWAAFLAGTVILWAIVVGTFGLATPVGIVGTIWLGRGLFGMWPKSKE